ncbi:MAG: CPBP family intramembrane metalloprotease, partial [Gammaproteobacteria bacterium]|nr:CPBP family intramembrane metalloprotease [Gammaproteobacteria bacterium]
PLALFEEAVFRAVVLGALLATFGDSGPAVAAAIVLSSVLFSAAHFVRRHGQVRNTLQPALGLAVVSVVLGIAYHVGDRTLWLPVALHAAGIVGNELPRSFSVYRGPAWLVGYR